MNKLREVFSDSLDTQQVRDLQAMIQEMEVRSDAEEWCCTCVHYIPEPTWIPP